MFKAIQPKSLSRVPSIGKMLSFLKAKDILFHLLILAKSIKYFLLMVILVMVMVMMVMMKIKKAVFMLNLRFRKVTHLALRLDNCDERMPPNTSPP